MNKTTYFNLVDEKKSVQVVIEALNVEYNEVIWTNNQEAIDFNEKAMNHYQDRLATLNRRLENGRTYFTKEELSEMAKEYKAR